MGPPKEDEHGPLSLLFLNVPAPRFYFPCVPGKEYIFYCKREILFLSSSKILTPFSPLRPASVYAFAAGGGQTRRAERDLEDERNRIALLQ